jgi:hypothetical protein
LEKAIGMTPSLITSSKVNDLCNHVIKIYPSQEFEDEYLTARPWIFVILVVVIFLFASVVIYIYGVRVEHRQHVVMYEAEKGGAIVQSMFPAAVRKRLYNTGEFAEKPGKHKVPAVVDSHKIRLKNFLDGSPENPLDGNPSPPEGKDAPILVSSCIAERFPEVTILFADVVGFTAWSSQREPGEVFMLLQTLYHSFDAEARRLGVFKVETVGDCYGKSNGHDCSHHEWET